MKTFTLTKNGQVIAENNNFKELENMIPKGYKATVSRDNKSYYESNRTKTVYAIETVSVVNVEEDSKEVTLVAFTGMIIGTFKAVRTATEYILTTAKGKELKFDTYGKQLNAKNERFANRLAF